MTENLLEQFRVLPANLANHLMITVMALVIGTAISLPLAVFVVRRAALRFPALTAVSVIQTIPSLALLALMYPLLLGVNALLARTTGIQVSALGLPPTIIALTLYSMLPMVRNTVTGITGVEPAVVEAARAMGMTSRQILLKVELPLAAPVIIAGIRTATVWVVGIATLATPVGQRCLGNYIFTGLQTQNWTAVTFGCVSAAVLAILLDVLIGGVQHAVEQRRPRRGVAAGGALLVVLIAGMIAPAVVRRLSAASRDHGAGAGVVRIGSKTFTEQYILAGLMARQLAAAGFDARRKESLGSTVAFDALVGGEIDCYVDYSGTIWANYMGRRDMADATTVLRELTNWLDREHGVTCLGALGFENAYGLAMRRRHAEQLNITAIGDLRSCAAGMKIGGDYEFFGRPEWRAIRDTYDLHFADQISYDSTFMYQALRDGEVDVISAFTSDGRIAAFDLAILEDPQGAIPPYDAVVLLSAEASTNQRLIAALRPLIGAIDVDTMRRANYMVDRQEDSQTVDHAARWLQARVLDP